MQQRALYTKVSLTKNKNSLAVIVNKKGVVLPVKTGSMAPLIITLVLKAAKQPLTTARSAGEIKA